MVKINYLTLSIIPKLMLASGETEIGFPVKNNLVLSNKKKT